MKTAFNANLCLPTDFVLRLRQEIQLVNINPNYTQNGYDPSKISSNQYKDFTKNRKGKYFTSASCYALAGPASMHIVKRVEELKKDI